jgi:hypothetical protein
MPVFQPVEDVLHYLLQIYFAHCINECTALLQVLASNIITKLTAFSFTTPSHCIWGENENASCCCPESTCLKIMALQETTFAHGHPVEHSPSSLNTPAICMHVTEMMTHKSVKTCSLLE